MPLGFEVGARLRRRGFFKAEGGKMDVKPTPELWPLTPPPLAPPSGVWLPIGDFATLPVCGAWGEEARRLALEQEEGVRVGEGCCRTWVRLRDRKRSPSVSRTVAEPPRPSVDCERVAGGFLRTEAEPEPGREPAAKA